MEGFQKRGVPPNGWSIITRENPIKMDDLGIVRSWFIVVIKKGSWMIMVAYGGRYN